MNAITESSGTTDFAPSLGDLMLDAFARCQIRSASLTAEHFFQARLSANLMMTEWANVGMPLLWAIDKMEFPLIPGVRDYVLPSYIAAPLDAYIRQYQLGTGQNFAPVFAADAGSQIVTVTQALHGYAAGQMVFFATAIAASGQVIQGTYLVDTIVDASNYQITVPTPMDGTDSVALPVFTTTTSSSTVAIVLANHGLAVGDSFYCNVAVIVGGLTLSGKMVVNGVVDQDNFTVGIGQTAGSTASATQNSGLARAAMQAPGVDPIDFILTQLSRSDYAAQPDKGPNLQFRPTTFWFQRRRTPILSLWNAPDDNGPYVFNLWYMAQPETLVVEGGVGVQLPFRYLAAFAAGLAARLAVKYPPPPDSGMTVAYLQAAGEDALLAALREDVERVNIRIVPGLRSYYR